MTIDIFHRDFKIYFDKTDSSAYPEFQDGEIDVYINEAIERLTKQRYGYNNIYRSGFEGMQKRTDDLKNLVVTRFPSISSSPVYQSVGDNVYVADLSQLYEESTQDTLSTDKYMFYLKAVAETCEGVDTCCSWSRVKLIQQDDLSSIVNDPFNKPTKSRPVVFFEDSQLYIWTGQGLSINALGLTFLRRPALVNIGTYGQPKVECDLSEHLHPEILQLAVNIAIENIQSPRVQTQGPINVQQVE